MKIYENIEQNSDEWFELRKLRFTASNASTILAKGKGLDTLICEMLTEYYSSNTFPEFTDKYVNNNIQRGHDYEDKARLIYELETGNVVKQVGFVEADEHEGCSPDGLIGDDGLLEIKCPNDKRFIQLILNEKIDSKYIAQVQMQLYVTQRKWCDFFAYNPNFPNPFIKRLYPDPETQNELKSALSEAKGRLKSVKAVLDKKMEGVKNAEE